MLASRVASGALLCASAMGLACGSSEDRTSAASHAPPAQREPAPAEGTVLRIDGRDVHVNEVDVLAAVLRRFQSKQSENQLRRIVLVRHLFERIAVEQRYPDEHEAAREQCAAALPHAPERDESDWLEEGFGYERLEGGPMQVGLEFWNAAQHLAPGAWSAPVDSASRVALLRLDRAAEPDDPHGRIEITVATLRYLPIGPGFAHAEACIDAAALTIVDPLWEKIVPESWKYRMSGNQP